MTYLFLYTWHRTNPPVCGYFLLNLINRLTHIYIMTSLYAILDIGSVGSIVHNVISIGICDPNNISYVLFGIICLVIHHKLWLFLNQIVSVRIHIMNALQLTLNTHCARLMNIKKTWIWHLYVYIANNTVIKAKQSCVDIL